MRRIIAGVAAGSLALFACGAPYRPVPAPVPVVTEVTADIGSVEYGVQPKNETRLLGDFDFDILGDVVGQGCYDPKSSNFKYAAVPNAGLGKGASHAAHQAQGAAIYDALTKSPGADTILVSWTKIDVHEDGRACAEMHGKAIRLRKAAPRPDAFPNAASPPPAALPPGTPPPAMMMPPGSPPPK